MDQDSKQDAATITGSGSPRQWCIRTVKAEVFKKQERGNFHFTLL